MTSLKRPPVIIISFLLASTMFSCMSTKKHQRAMVQWENKYSQLQTDYNSLQSDKQKSEAMASQNMMQSQKEIDAKNKALQDEQQKLQEMKALIDAQRNAIQNLKKEVCSALKCFTPDELTIEVRDGKLYVSMSDKLLFTSGSDVVNSRGTEAISMLGAVLANSDLEIMVEGHTDNVPISTSRNRDNWDLSAHRATNVTRIFIENGIKADRIIASGRGEFHPMESNASADGRQSNRRTEIVLSPKLDKLWKLTEEETAASEEKIN